MFKITSFQKKAKSGSEFRKFNSRKGISEFCYLVYSIVAKIPMGQTMTYKQVAVAIGNPRAYRAVGNALNKNYDLGIPCHRVIRSDGKIRGYNRGDDNKAELLQRENPKH